MGDKEKKYVHCLNSTLTATERTLCCIAETYQTPAGLRVPAVLQPFVGTDFIPYTVAVKRDNKKARRQPPLLPCLCHTCPYIGTCARGG
jgi:seryl-tRNA synthetase